MEILTSLIYSSFFLSINCNEKLGKKNHCVNVKNMYKKSQTVKNICKQNCACCFIV